MGKKEYVQPELKDIELNCNVQLMQWSGDMGLLDTPKDDIA